MSSQSATSAGPFVDCARRRPRDSELGRRRKAGGLERSIDDLARQAEIDRAAWFALRDLQRAAHDQSRVVLIFEAVIPLGELPDDAILIEGLLGPEM